jgi:hypothetical protein
MEDDLNFAKFLTMEDDLHFLKMEDDLIFFFKWETTSWHGREPQQKKYFKNAILPTAQHGQPDQHNNKKYIGTI